MAVVAIRVPRYLRPAQDEAITASDRLEPFPDQRHQLPEVRLGSRVDREHHGIRLYPHLTAPDGKGDRRRVAFRSVDRKNRRHAGVPENVTVRSVWVLLVEATG